MSSLWAFAMIAATAIDGPAASPSNDDVDVLRALTGVHESNRAKFAKVSIAFEYLDGYSGSLEEAIAGKIVGVSTSGVYACDGDDAVYTCVFPDAEVLARSTRLAENKASTTINSVRVLTNGRYTLSDRTLGDDRGGTSHAMIILPGAASFYANAEVPLNVGFPTEARSDLTYFTAAVLEKTHNMGLVRVEDGVQMDGRSTIRIEVKSPLGTRVMWVDPERGGIVLRAHEEMEAGTTREQVYRDVRFVPDAGWYPFERLLVLNGRRAKVITVKSITCGAPPRRMFQFDFDKPVAIANTADGVSYRARKSWRLSALPARGSADAIPIRPMTVDDDPVVEPRSVGLLWYLVYACVLICIGAATWEGWRAVRRAHAG